MECLVDGVAADRLQELYDQLYQEQRAENQAATSSGVEADHQGRLRPVPGVTDGRGSHEVWFLQGLEGLEVAQGENPPLAERQLRRPPDHMVAEARAPTAPPALGHPVDRIQYVDDELILGPQPVVADGEDDSVLESSSEEHSTIGQWTTDSGMPRGPSSGSAGTLNSARSLVASIQSARGHQGSEDESDWNLGTLVSPRSGCCWMFSCRGCKCSRMHVVVQAWSPSTALAGAE